MESKEPFYRLHGDTRQISLPGSSSSSSSTTTSSANRQQLLFSNDRIRVSDFRLRPSQSIAVAHEHPTVRWQVSYNGTSEHNVKIRSSSSNTVVNELSGSVEDRTIYYIKPEKTWEITNTSKDVEYRQIIFEILSNKPKYIQSEIDDLFSKAIYSTDVGTKLVFENELCRCWDFYLEPSEGGGRETVHHHCLDYVFVNVAPSRLLGLHPETLSLQDLLFDSISQDNQVTWNSILWEAATNIAFAHGGKNGYDDKPMREYLVELK